MNRSRSARALIIAIGLLAAALVQGQQQVPTEALPRLELAVPDGGVFAPREGPVVVPAPAPDEPRAPAPPGAPLATPGPPRIVELRIEGNERVSRDRIVGQLTQTVGDPFEQREATEDLRRLFALGEFSDVELELEKTLSGVVYIVRVEELPLLNEVRIGKVTQLREEALRAALALKTGEPLSASDLRESRERAEQALDTEGFDRTEVELRTQPAERPNTVDVIVEVHEQPRVRVSKIEFDGVPPERVEDVRRAVPLRPANLVTNVLGTSVYSQQRLEAAVEEVRTWYLNRGFARVQVESEVTFSSDGKRAELTFHLDEGPQFRIASVEITGAVPLPEGRAEELVSIEPGDPLSRDGILVEANALQTALQNEGYACAVVVPDVALDPAAETARLVLDVRAGKPARVGDIRVAGNTETKDYVVRRSVAVQPGDPFSATGIQQSLVNLRGLGFLEDVRVTLPEGCRNGEADLLVTVKEGKSTGYQLSLGFASTEKIVGTGRFMERNLFGTGRAISAFAQLSVLRSAVSVSYLEPFLLGSDIDLTLDVAHSRFQYPDFTRRGTGGTANFNWSLTRIQPALRPLTVNVGYNFQSVSVLQPPALPPESPQRALFREGRVSSIGLGLGWNQQQQQALVLTGPLLFGSVEGSPGLLGASLEFIRYTADARWNVGSLEGLLFRVRGTFGWIDALGDQPVPVTERYFLGGIGSLRGYRFRSISPVIRVDTGEGVQEIRVGGIWQAVGGAELEHPIVPSVRLNAVLFYDAGNAFGEDTGGVFDGRRNLPIGLFHAAGAGLRWYSPFGPIRLELAFPLNRRPEDPPQTIEIGIGALP